MISLYQKKVGNLTEWLIVLLCFAYPISAVFSLFLGINSTVFNIGYRGLAAFLAIYILLNSFRLPIGKKNMYIIPVIIFFIVYFFRLLYDIGVKNVVSDQKPFQVFTFFIGNIILSIFAISRGIKYCNFRRLIKRSFYTLALSNILILFTFFFQNEFSFTVDLLIGRAEVKGLEENSSLVNSISYGMSGGYLMMICLSILVFMTDVYSKKFKIWLYFFMVLGLANLLLGSSRGPVIFTILDCMLLCWIYLNSGKNIGKYVQFLIITIAILFLGAYLLNYLSANNVELGIFDRIGKLGDQIERGEKETRNFLYNQALEMFYNSPFIGSQYVLPPEGGYPHNMFLEVLMSLGFLGLIIYSSILFSYQKKIRTFKKYSVKFLPLVFLSVLSFGLTMTTGNIYQNVDFWNLLAVILLFPNINNELYTQ